MRDGFSRSVAVSRGAFSLHMGSRATASTTRPPPADFPGQRLIQQPHRTREAAHHRAGIHAQAGRGVDAAPRFLGALQARHHGVVAGTIWVMSMVCGPVRPSNSDRALRMPFKRSLRISIGLSSLEVRASWSSQPRESRSALSVNVVRDSFVSIRFCCDTGGDGGFCHGFAPRRCP